jgi:arabinose-5-phosphate isomerase
MESLMAMTKAKSGSAAVVDGENRLIGIFTDGDFRRAVSEKRVNLEEPVSTVMTSPAMFVRDDVYAAELLKIFEKKRIDDLPVCDAEGKVVGVVDIQDLPKMKIM